MTIITNNIRITRPIECIRAIFTSDMRGLVVEYEDHTGVHTICGVTRIINDKSIKK